MTLPLVQGNMRARDDGERKEPAWIALEHAHHGFRRTFRSRRAYFVILLVTVSHFIHHLCSVMRWSLPPVGYWMIPLTIGLPRRRKVRLSRSWWSSTSSAS
jgi:hypothetical protein